MGFVYRAAVGKLIYALITYQPDISFAVTNLIQYSHAPAVCHYVAIKNVFRYSLSTINDGLIYWRKQPNNDIKNNYEPTAITPLHEWSANMDRSIHVPLLYNFVDSDWASDTSHHQSVSGITYIMAGVVVICKTKFQQTVAMSSTEAEFVAASEAGKISLYLCSFLTDIGKP